MTPEGTITISSQQSSSSVADHISRILRDGFVEIEFKLLADPTVLQEIEHSDWVRSLAVGPVWRQPLLTHYYDTPDFKLHHAGLVLRVRWNGKKWEQSVKVRASADRGLFRRMEWQQLIHKGRPDVDTLFGNQGALSYLAISSYRLDRIFSTRFERTTIPLMYPCADGSASTQITLSLDDGAIEAEAVSQPISEIELELLTGPEEGLHRFSLALSERFPVVPGTLSKADRGFRLITDRGRTAVPG